MPEDFETECRRKFAYYCEQYQVSPFHAEKKTWAAKAYGVIDAFLDFRDLKRL